MSEREMYHPPSDFLMSVLDEDVTFGDHAFGRENLARLIALTGDADDGNRDWATFVLAQLEQDSPAIRQALSARLADPHRDTRHEALVGLALRDRMAALPYVLAELQQEVVYSQVLEAAAAVADASLTPILDEIAEGWSEGETDEWFARLLETARRACADGIPRDQ